MIWPAPARACRARAPGGTAWCEECVRKRGPLLAADPGMPEEPGGLRQAGGLPGGTGYGPRLGSRLGRPRGRQHLRLHRGRPPGVHRHRARAGRPARRGCAPGGHRLHGRALRRRADRALPEVDLVAGFGQELFMPADPPPVPVTLGATRATAERTADRRLRSARAAPPRHPLPVGLRQGGRGLRPHLWLLRHSVLPGQAALPLPSDVLAEVDALGRAASGPARRPCARSSWWPRTSRPTAATAPDPDGPLAPRTARRPSPPSPAQWRPGWTAPACSTSIRRA